MKRIQGVSLVKTQRRTNINFHSSCSKPLWNSIPIPSQIGSASPNDAHRSSNSSFNNHDQKEFSGAKSTSGIENNQSDHTDHKIYLSNVGKQLGVLNLEDWYNVTTKQFVVSCGPNFLQSYNGSLIQALKSVYPDFHWKEYKFKVQPKNFWKSKDNQRLFLDDVGKELGIRTLEDWYNVSVREFASTNGMSFLQNYNSSLITALKSVYPEFPWKDYKFKSLPKNYWNKKNIRTFLDEVGRDFGVVRMEDWYGVTAKQFKEKYGPGLLNHYNSSLIEALRVAYPEYPWKDFKFEVVPKNFWLNKDNQRAFLQEAGRELGVKKMEDWYGISAKQFKEKYGLGFLSNYNHSLIEALKAVYPEYPWKPLKFERVTKHFWLSKDNQRAFLNEVGEELGVSVMADWNRVTIAQIIHKGGARLLNQYNNSLISALKSLYPTFEWGIQQTLSKTSIGQAQLFKCLKEIFPHHQPLVNHKHNDLIHTSGRVMELDFWYPELKLAFEYQGLQHYKSTIRGSFARQLERDSEKHQACVDKGITLISIPYWWNFKQSSLIATIYKERPDLVDACMVPTNVEPISSLPHSVQANRNKAQMDPSCVFISQHAYGEYVDPVGKILTEKFDGVRAIWNPKSQCFVLKPSSLLSKLLTLSPPAWFAEQLPHKYLDGDLWYGYEGFFLRDMLLQKEIADSEWKNIHYKIFNTPDPSLCNLPYPDRMNAVQNLLSHNRGNVEVIPFQTCHTRDQFNMLMEDTLRKGGLGLLIHENAPYVPSVAPLMWKWKVQSSHFDAEFDVFGNLPATTSELQEGQTFVYSFYGIWSSMKPLFPQAERVFPLPWKQISPYVIGIQNDNMLVNQSEENANIASPMATKTKLRIQEVTCRSCGGHLAKNELRVKVNSLLQYANRGLRVVPLSFCLTQQCMQTQLKHKHKKKNILAYPDFDGRLLLSCKKEELDENQAKQLETFVNGTQDWINITYL